MIGQASEGFRKQLFSDKPSGERPQLVVAGDELAQVDYVIERVLEYREAGIDLKRQAVLFRASHHSDQLEVELARRGIPFVKYGGLKFLEAAHVKDALCVLRWSRTLATASPPSVYCNCCPASAPPPRGRLSTTSAAPGGTSLRSVGSGHRPPPHRIGRSCAACFPGCAAGRHPGRGRWP